MTTARSTGAECSEEELETCVWKAKQVVYARAQEQTLKLVSIDVHLILALCYLYILACWQNYYRT